MPEGCSDARKVLAARAVIGNAGIEIRFASADPGNLGADNILTVGTGGYQHPLINNGEIAISAAGVVTFPSARKDIPMPTGDYSAEVTWVALFTRDPAPAHIANIDIQDLARPGTQNTLNIPANRFRLTPMP